MTSTFTPALSRQLEWAAQVVEGVRCGRSLTEVLAALPSDLRPGVQAIASDALRRLGAASEVRARLAARAPPPWVDALLLVALTLLWPAPAPAYAPHTVVDQAVQAAKARAPASAGFVNALLRRFLREREGLLAAIATLPQARWNHPRWWVDRLRADWPQSWQALLAAADQRPPMTLRVNRRRMSGASYLQHLQAAGQAASLLPGPDLGGQALVLRKPCPVEQLPGFADGWASVQDAAAQRAAALLLGPAGLSAGARVLDACAAPGGKTAHLLESADLDLLALDSDPARLDRVRSTLERLRLVARLQAADAGAAPTGGTAARSTPSCSTPRAAPRASSGATRTSAGCGGQATSRRWRVRRANCWTPCGPRWAPAGGCCTRPARCSRPRAKA
jgi:16S rRNA (cytosine967-C5)-methyltransferase